MSHVSPDAQRSLGSIVVNGAEADETPSSCDQVGRESGDATGYRDHGLNDGPESFPHETEKKRDVLEKPVEPGGLASDADSARKRDREATRDLAVPRWLPQCSRLLCWLDSKVTFDRFGSVCMASKVVARHHVDQNHQRRSRSKLSCLKSLDEKCCCWRL